MFFIVNNDTTIEITAEDVEDFGDEIVAVEGRDGYYQFTETGQKTFDTLFAAMSADVS